MDGVISEKVREDEKIQLFLLQFLTNTITKHSTNKVYKNKDLSSLPPSLPPSLPHFPIYLFIFLVIENFDEKTV